MSIAICIRPGRCNASRIKDVVIHKGKLPMVSLASDIGASASVTYIRLNLFKPLRVTLFQMLAPEVLRFE